MKIALVAPHFPPDFCGVGDHSYKLARALAALDHDIQVWTTQPKPVKAGFPVHVLGRPWTAASFQRTGAELGEFAPDLVLIQYTPYLYSESGGPLTLLLPLWISWLRARLGARVGVVAHELHYPLNFSVAGLLRGVPQLQAFSGIAMAANHVLFTYEATWRRYRSLMPWLAGGFHWLPVGANIEPEQGARAPVATALKRGRVPAGHKILLHFGGAHPTQLLSWTFEALEHALKDRKLGGRVTLVFAGNSQARIDAELLACGKLELKAHIRALGQISAAEASVWLSHSDVILAPFLDGVCTRRSSLISALAHGQPVVTTSGYSTDRSMGWDKACVVVPSDRKAEFAAETLRLLTSEKKRKAQGTAGARFYEKNFKWDILARKLIEAFG